MSVREHTYPVPTEAELAQMVGAATPHFALQVRDRVASLAATLPADHPRRPELIAHIARLDALAVGGEAGEEGQAELPPRPSLEIPSRAGAELA
jgi:hypothetical protein